MKHDEDKSTEVRARVDDTPAANQSFFLKVTEGPDAGKRFELDPNGPGRTLIGKSPACEIRLSDPTVSRRHAALEIGERGLRLIDLESRNGTFVNNIRIADGFLRGGETLLVGSTHLSVDMGAAAPVSIPTSMRFGK